MNYVSFVATIIYFGIVVWTNIYILGKYPEEFVSVCVGLLHVIFGVGIAFFILYRAFYGAALGKPCFLLYKVAEGAFIVVSFYLLLKSRLGIKGISFAFSEADKPKGERDMALIWFSSA